MLVVGVGVVIVMVVVGADVGMVDPEILKTFQKVKQ